MDQKTIDKVLRCRAIIDRHKSWLADQVLASEAAIAEAVDKLPAKDKENASKLAEIAKAAKIPDHDQAVAVERMLAELKSEGFSDVGQYADWDRQRCFELFQEYVTIDGACDGCAGLRGTPPCISLWGEKACYHQSNPRMTKEQVLGVAFAAWRNKTITERGGEIPTNKGGCPAGHGFHVSERTKTNKSSAPFSTRWKV